MKRLFRRTIAAVVAVSAMSLCNVPTRGDQYYASTGVRGGAEAVNIQFATGGINGGYYANYQTTVGTSTNNGVTVNNQVTYNTFCVDLTHEATSSFQKLGTPAMPSTSSYTGGGSTGASVPTGTSDSYLGLAAWLANSYSSSATTMDQQAGLQIAIWKVLYETDRSMSGLENLSAGAITFSAYGGYTAALSYAVTYITGWVNAGEKTSSAYLVNYATDAQGNHDQYQLVTAVPEPSTLGIACLGVVGFVGYELKRRRRQRQ